MDFCINELSVITHKFHIVIYTQIRHCHSHTKFNIAKYTQIQYRHFHTNSISSFSHKSHIGNSAQISDQSFGPKVLLIWCRVNNIRKRGINVLILAWKICVQMAILNLCENDEIEFVWKWRYWICVKMSK